jgi:endonuclease/exonuclease/phosphatase family metal-dependent hydrolase
MYYYGLKSEKVSKSQRARIVDGLVRLRAQLDQELPGRSLESSFLIATWNLREFGGKKFGGRLLDSKYFIAEVISRFDLVAVQEVRPDLRELKELVRLLGGWWDYLVTDVTYGQSGNQERMAFLFDKRTVRFDNLAGEVVIPGSPSAPPLQLARTPYVCSFRASWARFDICTAHIYYGESTANDERRVNEIAALAQLLRKEVAGEVGDPLGRNLVLLGDFNVFNRKTDKTMKALDDAGFQMPPKLRASKTNALGNKEYDQIAYLKRDGRFEMKDNGGVFDLYKSVFRDEDEAAYADDRKGKGKSFEDWRSYQISDHLPLWVELRSDFSAEYLDDLAKL